MTMHKRRFHESFCMWSSYCRFLGFYSYDVSDQRISKSKYYYLYYIQNILLNLLAEIYFTVTFRSSFPIFGIITQIMEYSIIFIEIGLRITSEDQLFSIFSSFDDFDRLFQVNTGRKIQQKKIHEVFTIQLLLCTFIVDYLAMVFVAVHYRTLHNALFISVLRTFERTSILLLLIMHLHFIDSLMMRFKLLKEIVSQNTDLKLLTTFSCSRHKVHPETVRLMYNQLLNIVELISDCFGPSFVVVFAQVCYRVLKYFYLTCTGIHFATLLQIYPLSIILILTITAENLQITVSVFFDPIIWILTVTARVVKLIGKRSNGSFCIDSSFKTRSSLPGWRFNRFYKDKTLYNAESWQITMNVFFFTLSFFYRFSLSMGMCRIVDKSIANHSKLSQNSNQKIFVRANI